MAKLKMTKLSIYNPKPKYPDRIITNDEFGIKMTMPAHKTMKPMSSRVESIFDQKSKLKDPSFQRQR